MTKPSPPDDTELFRLYRTIAGTPGLFLPGPPPNAALALGPAMHVRLKFSEVYPDRNAEAVYWELLRHTPVRGGIGVLSAIGSLLVSDSVLSRDAHRILEERFAAPAVRAAIQRGVNEARSFSVVFSHLSALLLISHLAAYGDDGVVEEEETPDVLNRIGELFLCANEFFDHEPTFGAAPAHEDLMHALIPTWDLLNRRDLAYTFTRMYTLLDYVLTSNDRTIEGLRRAAFAGALPTMQGLPLSEFVGIVFGLFAWGQGRIKETPRLIFDQSDLLRSFPGAQAALQQLLGSRARTIPEFRAALTGQATDHASFLAHVLERRFLRSGINLFRTTPLLRLDETRVAILDLQFLAELLSQGVYWAVFDGLVGNRKERFRELWGHAFEHYVGTLLAYFYPPASGMLQLNVPYEGGQIDALLDFGPIVFVFEIKSSLLTEPAKRGGDRNVLLADILKKFVRREDGTPKAVVQLAHAVRAIADGRVCTVRQDPRVYPLLVTDEIAAEVVGFNAYLNDHLAPELPANHRSTPLTVLSIGELEELLPCAAAGHPSLQDLLEQRFTRDGGVNLASVHQALYDFLQRNGGEMRRNAFMLKEFERIYQLILQLYQGKEA